jgi:excinuclease ABC subunit A
MDKIKIVGAREHNLKNIDLEIPRDKFVVITGLSGSGKSSLVFDTIFAEGQRRYVESLSSYARQFLGVMEKPDVDYIEGLSPAISIDQKSASRNPRSTVGTITEIYDYMRLIFARIGHPHCPNCGQEIKKQSANKIVEIIENSCDESCRVLILSPQISDRKGEHRDVFARIRKIGFVRVRVDGTVMDLDEAEDKTLDKQKKHSIEIVVDRLILENPTEINDKGREAIADDHKRLFDSVEKALQHGEGRLIVADVDRKQERFYSENFSCSKCNISISEISPRAFSFNSPHGACQTCQGLGNRLEIDPSMVIPNRRLTIAEGAIRPWSRTVSSGFWYLNILEAVGQRNGFSINDPISKFSDQQINIILNGTKEEVFRVNGSDRKYEGVIPNMYRRYRESESEYIKKEIEKYMVSKICPVCRGGKLRADILGVTVNDRNIVEISQMTIAELIKWFSEIETKLSESEKKIANQAVKEISERLKFLDNVGLPYLTLDRNASTLAGGEAQRIRLATQIGSGLMGVLYILDEPSIGLHQRDNQKLLETLKNLRDLGNTVIVVEHDEETMRTADWLIDIGPGAGEHGGRVVSCGLPKDVAQDENSITGDYLSGKKKIIPPKVRHFGNGQFLEIFGAAENNLKNIDVKIPLNTLTCITGVSGSGKSTLVSDILAKVLLNKFHHARTIPGKYRKIEGMENLDKVIDIDQSPIGRTPRSNPATYTGAFTYIRDLFSMTKDAKLRGYRAGRFSFNVKGGRCEACRGDGVKKIEMHFLPDVYVTCEECHGKRYNQEVLEICYKGKNIFEVLDMTVEESTKFFENIPAIYTKLRVLNDVGLGYIKLGQSATTLSGGEAQRIKLATELARKSTGKTLYILDEPTTGLHFEDIKRLLDVLFALVEKGNTIMIIEHNLDVIKSADHIIDLGPEGGDGGGEIIAVGTPEEVAKIKKSYTGQFLKKALS